MPERESVLVCSGYHIELRKARLEAGRVLVEGTVVS